jgi:hypothetical protein
MPKKERKVWLVCTRNERANIEAVYAAYETRRSAEDYALKLAVKDAEQTRAHVRSGKTRTFQPTGTNGKILVQKYRASMETPEWITLRVYVTLSVELKDDVIDRLAELADAEEA